MVKQNSNQGIQRSNCNPPCSTFFYVRNLINTHLIDSQNQLAYHFPNSLPREQRWFPLCTILPQSQGTHVEPNVGWNQRWWHPSQLRSRAQNLCILLLFFPPWRSAFALARTLNKTRFCMWNPVSIPCKTKKSVCRQYRQIVKEEEKKTYWRYPLAFLWFENHTAFLGRFSPTGGPRSKFSTGEKCFQNSACKVPLALTRQHKKRHAIA